MAPTAGSNASSLGFQCCTVGLNRGLRSPVAAVLQSALQPLFGLLLLVLLADGPLRQVAVSRATSEVVLFPKLMGGRTSQKKHVRHCMHICFGELTQEVERAKPGMKVLYLRLYSFRCWNYSTCVELWFLGSFRARATP